jgi:hypothetical protein
MKCKLYLSVCVHAQAGFPDEIKAADCEVLKHLTNLPEIDADAETPDRLQTIEKLHKELSDPAHPVSIATKKMQDIPEVKYPAAMAGQDRANFLRGNSEVLTRGAMLIVDENPPRELKKYLPSPEEMIERIKHLEAPLQNLYICTFCHSRENGCHHLRKQHPVKSISSGLPLSWE